VPSLAREEDVDRPAGIGVVGAAVGAAEALATDTWLEFGSMWPWQSAYHATDRPSSRVEAGRAARALAQCAAPRATSLRSAVWYRFETPIRSQGDRLAHVPHRAALRRRLGQRRRVGGVVQPGLRLPLCALRRAGRDGRLHELPRR